MLSRVLCFGLLGLDAYPIAIETDISSGLPSFTIVGLPDSAIRESRERVRAAIRNSGYTFPPGRITINLSPADTKKEGPAFDLAIAIGILSASEQIQPSSINGYVFLGELSLDGTIMPINGSLAFALAADPISCKGLFVPCANAREAAIAKRIPIYPVQHLKELIFALNQPDTLRAFECTAADHASPVRRSMIDFSDVKGQQHVKRGLEIAAAGGHNVLLIGPPGSGKTMLAKRLAGILPDMSHSEMLEVTRIHSVSGLLSPNNIQQDRPFRSPHHTASDIALIGGGSVPKPGEVTLAHNGILFLDELPEFSRHVLEVLRQPLEDHCVSVSRATRTLKFPARFMLVAAMNPCPCGWGMGGKKPCTCSSIQVERYRAKISGPLLDRIDIHLEAHALKTPEMFSLSSAEPSAAIKKRTVHCRNIQSLRFADDDINANAQMSAKILKTHCVLDERGQGLIKQAVEKLGLSVRAHDKILKISRTIADLEGSADIQTPHIAEAIGYRALDRMK